jgi:uncharacterized Fe-S cluster-containing radical SAM superfamily protein
MDMQRYFIECRNSVYNKSTQQVLLSRISGSEQEKDLSLPPNCCGVGRVHHFRRKLDEDWFDPLPMDPMSKSLGLPIYDIIQAQVFQIASCNLNCWYCFVPNNLKIGDRNHSSYFTSEQMIDMFIKENINIRIIDLSGGNPELTPEWILETMKALENRKLSDKIYLWSDDALTTGFFFSELSKSDVRYIKQYPHFGKVGCFKGFDARSFCFNTSLDGSFFDKQFELFQNYLTLGIDIYGYVTFTTDCLDNLEEKIHLFIHRLKGIHSFLPLRIVPLKIIEFSPVKQRLNQKYEVAINNQTTVFHEWRRQLHKLYSNDQLAQRICDVSIS